MEKDFEAEKIDKKRVALVSEYNGLSISLVEKLLANFFRVTVFCVKRELWFNNAPYLKNNHLLSFDNLEKRDEVFDYSIFVSAFFDNLYQEKEKDIILKEDLRIKSLLSSIKVREKRFFLLPYFVFDSLGKSLTRVYEQNIKQGSSFENLVIYLGNLIGPRIILSNRDELLMVLKSLVEDKKIEIPVISSCQVRPSRVGSVSRKIVSLLFSSDLNYFRIIVSSSPVVLKKWIGEVENEFQDLRYSFSSTGLKKVNGVFDKEILIDETVDFKFLKQTINWFKDSKDIFYLEGHYLSGDSSVYLKNQVLDKKEDVVSLKISENFRPRKFLDFHFPILNLEKIRTFFSQRKTRLGEKIKKTLPEKKEDRALSKLKLPDKSPLFKKKEFNLSFMQKYIIFSLSAILTLLLVPTISLFLSIASVYFGQRLLKNGSFSYAKYAFSFERELADFSLSQFYFYSDTPFIGRLFVVPAKLANISSQTSEITLLAIDGAQKTLSLVEKSFNGQEIPLNSYSQDLTLTFDSIYQKASFLEGQLREIKDSWPFTYLSPYIDKIDLPRRREEIQAAKVAFSLIGKVLGEDREKIYLLLLQNNMELRPTGGFIGSFAIVGFNKGAMTKFEVYDVYDADGQLKGYVEPPWQLKEYLNQPAWYLRDSNWDPDFSKSAQKAEWFLDKSMNIQVDGVIAVDLDFTRDLVGAFGSVYVADFDKRIDPKNFYEIVQYEAEKNFFPGSRQKENFLLALSRTIFNDFKSADKRQIVQILETSYQNLNKRHIQVFLHEARLQEKIDNLGWSGAIREPVCSLENCLSDWASLIEANLGVNKANYFIDRDLKLNVDVNQETIKRSLEINFTNKAQTFMGDKGKYKAYVRLLLPIGVEVKKVALGDQNNLNTVDFKEELVGGRKEVGFLLELGPLESKKVVFEWSGGKAVDLSKNGEYRFYLRKQAGIDSFPFSFEANFPSNFVVGTDRLFHLTKRGSFTYNVQNLSEDFVSRFYW